jgi:uncharacterized protein (DUF983 family)
MDDEYNVTTNPAWTGLVGKCPRCQEGDLFAGPIKLADACNVCGLDYSFADPADGPAFFSMSIVAFPALAFALWVQFKFEPPLWVNLITTIPLMIIVAVALLRPLKGWLVCSQFVHKAQEGTIDSGWNETSRTRREDQSG